MIPLADIPDGDPYDVNSDLHKQLYFEKRSPECDALFQQARSTYLNGDPGRPFVPLTWVTPPSPAAPAIPPTLTTTTATAAVTSPSPEPGYCMYHALFGAPKPVPEYFREAIKVELLSLTISTNEQIQARNAIRKVQRKKLVRELPVPPLEPEAYYKGPRPGQQKLENGIYGTASGGYVGVPNSLYTYADADPLIRECKQEWRLWKYVLQSVREGQPLSGYTIADDPFMSVRAESSTIIDGKCYASVLSGHGAVPDSAVTVRKKQQRELARPWQAITTSGGKFNVPLGTALQDPKPEKRSSFIREIRYGLGSTPPSRLASATVSQALANALQGIPSSLRARGIVAQVAAAAAGLAAPGLFDMFVFDIFAPDTPDNGALTISFYETNTSSAVGLGQTTRDSFIDACPVSLRAGFDVPALAQGFGARRYPKDPDGKLHFLGDPPSEAATMLNYILRRYGTTVRALAFHLLNNYY